MPQSFVGVLNFAMFKIVLSELSITIPSHVRPHTWQRFSHEYMHTMTCTYMHRIDESPRAPQYVWRMWRSMEPGVWDLTPWFARVAAVNSFQLVLTPESHRSPGPFVTLHTLYDVLPRYSAPKRYACTPLCDVCA